MKIGVHLLNPNEDTYIKEVKLPDNCKLVDYTWDDYYQMLDKRVEQIGNVLYIECVKSFNITAVDFSRIVPLYLEFDFNTDNQEPITEFGIPYYVCNMPEIFGAYWRKKA
jgi:hypothetical protein